VHTNAGTGAVAFEDSGGIDDSIHAGEPFAPGRGGVRCEIAGRGLGRWEKAGKARGVAATCDDFVAGADEFRGEPSTDEATRASDQDAHGLGPPGLRFRANGTSAATTGIPTFL
jgi:hypothetical protein